MSGGNPISAVTDAFSSALGTDGSHGGLLGMAAQLDKSVHDTIPGGWATLGIAALAIAAPYLAPMLAEGALTGEALATADGFAQAAGYETAAEALNAGVDAASLGLPAGTTAAGVTDAATALATTAGGTGTGLTSGSIDAALQQGVPLQSLLNSAGTGALTGGTMGGVKAAITGQDPLTAILSGAITGGLTGGALDSLTSPALAAQMGWAAPLSTPVASALLSATTAIANGADPKAVLSNAAISGALSSIGGQANSAMSGSIPSPVANAIVGAATGAAGSAIKGGNVATGAETGAIGATVGSGLNALTAPSASITPAPVTDNSQPYTSDNSLLQSQLKAEADLLSGKASGQLTDLQNAQGAVTSSTDTTTAAYNQAKSDQAALSDAYTKTYQPEYANVQNLQQTASGLYTAATQAESAYNTAYKAFQDNPTQANYDAANAASKAYTDAVNAYTPANTAFQTANTNLQKLYDTAIAPLQTVATSSTNALNTSLQQYGANQSTLTNVANSLGTTLSGLSQISNGQLASGLNIPDVAMSAPSAQVGPQPGTDSLTANNTPTQATFDVSKGQPVSLGGVNYVLDPVSGKIYNQDGSSSTLTNLYAANNPSSVTAPSAQIAGGTTASDAYPTPTESAVGIYSDQKYMKDSQGNDTTILNPFYRESGNPVGGSAAGSSGNPIVNTSIDQTTGNKTVTYASGDTLTTDMNGDVVSETAPPKDNTGTSQSTTGSGTSTAGSTPTASDVVANIIGSQTGSSGTGTTGSGTGAGAGTSTGTGAGAGTQTGTTPGTSTSATSGTGTSTATGTSPTGTTTGATTGATGTGITTGGASTGTNTAGGTGTTTGATTGATGTGTITGGAGTGTNTTGGTSTSGTSTSGTSPTGGTTDGTGTSTTTDTGTGTGTGTGLSTGAGALAAASALGFGSTSSGLSNVASSSNTPKATLIKGSQIASPLASNYAIPVDTYNPPAQNAQALEQIKEAKNGGIIHKAAGGDLPMTPQQLRGSQTSHANLFGSRGAQLTGLPHLQNGGPAPMYADAGRPTSYEDRTLPEGHNPQFFSEGGLGSLHNRYVQGAGDGTSDSIPAMLANGEFVIPADVVSSLGNGSNESGAHVLDAFLKTVREHKQKHDAKHLPPDSKGALAYLLQAKQKVSK